MTSHPDIYADIVGELTGKPVLAAPALAKSKSTLEDLLGAATEIGGEETPSPVLPAMSEPAEWTNKALMSAAAQAAEERSKREVAEREAARAKSLIGWSVAGVLAAVLLYIIGARGK